MITKPDFDNAAIKAMETIIANNISTTPIIPLPVLKRMPGVGIKSLTELSFESEEKRNEVRSLFGKNMDAMTFHVDTPQLKYLVCYNQRLPFYTLQRGLARELGHIVLGHDGKRMSEEARMAEAYCFAHHFLCPRPLINAVQEAGYQITIETLGNMTGCYTGCLKNMRKEPGAHVPAELNRKVKKQFSLCINEFIELQAYLSEEDDTPIADFGTYMDCYEE